MAAKTFSPASAPAYCGATSFARAAEAKRIAGWVRPSSAMMLTASTIPSSRVCSGFANRFERHSSSSAKPR